MTTAVTTPTGHVGSHVVRMLCQAGVRPRALLRDPARLDAEPVEPVVGDLRDADWTGRQVQAVHGPADLTWTDAATALSTTTGRTIEARQITADEQRAALRGAGLSEVVAEGIVGISAGFTPEQPRSALTTTPSSLVGWAATHLRPAL
jgi:uncharacterized protein YbjT (DUF2867 family)